MDAMMEMGKLNTARIRKATDPRIMDVKRRVRQVGGAARGSGGVAGYWLQNSCVRMTCARPLTKGARCRVRQVAGLPVGQGVGPLATGCVSLKWVHCPVLASTPWAPGAACSRRVREASALWGGCQKWPPPGRATNHAALPQTTTPHSMKHKFCHFTSHQSAVRQILPPTKLPSETPSHTQARRSMKRESKVQLSDEIIFFDDVAGNEQAKVGGWGRSHGAAWAPVVSPASSVGALVPRATSIARARSPEHHSPL